MRTHIPSELIFPAAALHVGRQYGVHGIHASPVLSSVPESEGTSYSQSTLAEAVTPGGQRLHHGACARDLLETLLPDAAR